MLAHLVKFHNMNGINFPVPDASRDDYLSDLSKTVFKELDDKFQK